MCRAVIVDLAIIAKEHGSHEDLTLDRVSVLVGVVLGHDTTKRVARDHDVVTSETSLSELFEGILDVVIDENRLRGIQ